MAMPGKGSKNLMGMRDVNDDFQMGEHQVEFGWVFWFGISSRLSIFPDALPHFSGRGVVFMIRLQVA